ncbi:MAG: penicillin acylase family protein, partial [Holophagales bacterium]|nr:penicillin acylase family protein [Holophagales bacterium]
MKKLVRIGLVSVGLVVLLVLVAVSQLPRLSHYQVDGEISLAGAGSAGLEAPVEVVRDGQGMPYLRAASLDDLLFAQGFVTAQDRLFSMELSRRFAQGTVSEMAGERSRELDIRQRTIGFRRLAEAQAEVLDPDTRRALERYVDGVNAYVELRADTHPIEFRLAGIEPSPWSVVDSLSVLFLMSWNSSANLKHEIVSQMLVDVLGPERAALLAPINLDPDVDPFAEPEGQPSEPSAEVARLHPIPFAGIEGVGFASDPALRSLTHFEPLALGSNNWVVAGERSPGGKPVLAGDPHLDPRVLPGVWHPVGLALPGWRAVGVAVPGLPGVSLLRSSHVALSVTNAYGDAQDLFVETLDPADPSRYLEPEEGGAGCTSSKPFEILRETLRIQDPDALGGVREEAFEIRLTPRGPVVSGILKGASGAEEAQGEDADRVVTLRWAAAEALTERLGFLDLLTARSVDEVDAAIGHLPMIGLNVVFADVRGRLGYRVSGRLPRRVEGAGRLPWPVCPAAEGAAEGGETASQEEPEVVPPDEAGLRWPGDPWTGWIPFDDMPHARDPERGWLGTANHWTIGPDFPHYYSGRAASSYRYR